MPCKINVLQGFSFLEGKQKKKEMNEKLNCKSSIFSSIFSTSKFSNFKTQKSAKETLCKKTSAGIVQGFGLFCLWEIMNDRIDK